MYSLVCSYLIDNLFKITIKESARYYLLHVILNSYIVYVTYRESIDFFLSPIIKYDIYTTSSIESASIIIGFHIYHYLTDILDFETKIHHIVTVFITGSTALLIPTGSTTSAINFISSTHLYGRLWGSLNNIPYLHFELCYYLYCWCV